MRPLGIGKRRRRRSGPGQNPLAGTDRGDPLGAGTWVVRAPTVRVPLVRTLSVWTVEVNGALGGRSVGGGVEKVRIFSKMKGGVNLNERCG